MSQRVRALPEGDMPTDALTFCKERLAEMRKVCDAASVASQESWTATDKPSDACCWNAGVEPHVADTFERAVADFLVTAHTALPALLAAWEQEIARHEPVVYGIKGGAQDKRCSCLSGQWPCLATQILTLSRNLGWTNAE
jgi:hypothetical protein